MTGNKLSELLLPIILQEFPLLEREEQVKLAEIISEYISLLDGGRIDESEDFLRKNHDLLVKLL